MKRVLVTGASGFIGRQVLMPLLDRGCDVHAVHLGPLDSALAVTKGVVWHKADLLDPSSHKSLIGNAACDTLIHFAWYAKHGVYWTSPLNMDWLSASLSLSQGFVEAGGTRIVTAGTCAEYDWSNGYCAEDATPCRPTTLYGEAKLALYKVLTAYAEQRQFSYAHGRIFFTFGPYESESRLVASVINSLLKGENALCSHGLQRRDFLASADVASAFVALAGSDIPGAVNIGSGIETTIGELATKIASVLNAEDRLQMGAIKVPDNDPPMITATSSRLRDEVGWKPATTLDRRIDQTIGWWRSRISGGQQVV